jgi:hypothetical protein
MKTKKLIVEIICLLLLLNFFYEGIYKLFYIQKYGFWLHHATFLKPISRFFTYTIPIGEIILSILFLVPSCRVFALYSSLGLLISFILYIASTFLFSHSIFFWPYHAFWDHPTWMQKMISSLILSWLAFAAIILSGTKFSINMCISNSLRNKPANVSR